MYNCVASGSQASQPDWELLEGNDSVVHAFFCVPRAPSIMSCSQYDVNKDLLAIWNIRLSDSPFTVSIYKGVREICGFP